MIVRSVDDVQGSDREVRGKGWTSLRLLLRDDGMGFSMSETVLDPGMDQVLWYKHHLEACFCVEGRAEVEDLATGDRYELRPGTVYALDRHDRHRLRVLQRTRLVCVFRPPLSGGETHDADGSYAPPQAEG